MEESSYGDRAIQILIGLMHIGFGGISGAFFGHYTPISFIGGYPFWRGLSVRGSLGKNIISAIFSAIGISLLLTELIINASYRYFGLAATKGITVLLLLFTILEFSIAVSISYFACLAICYTPNTAMLFRPYLANANLGVPSAQMASPEPPTNVD